MSCLARIKTYTHNISGLLVVMHPQQVLFAPELKTVTKLTVE